MDRGVPAVVDPGAGGREAEGLVLPRRHGGPRRCSEPSSGSPSSGASSSSWSTAYKALRPSTRRRSCAPTTSGGEVEYQDFVDDLRAVAERPGFLNEKRQARLPRELAVLELRLDVVAVQEGDEVDADLLGARGLALAVVGAAPEQLLHGVDHGGDALEPLRLPPAGAGRGCDTLAAVNSWAAPFGHAATHAPHPMHAAASMEPSAALLRHENEVGVGERLPVGAVM